MYSNYSVQIKLHEYTDQVHISFQLVTWKSQSNMFINLCTLQLECVTLPYQRWSFKRK